MRVGGGVLQRLLLQQQQRRAGSSAAASASAPSVAAPHAAATWHRLLGHGTCAVMWFWILYRAKQDGAALLGLEHPWEHHHDAEEEGQEHHA